MEWLKEYFLLISSAILSTLNLFFHLNFSLVLGGRHIYCFLNIKDKTKITQNTRHPLFGNTNVENKKKCQISNLEM